MLIKVLQRNRTRERREMGGGYYKEMAHEATEVASPKSCRVSWHPRRADDRVPVPGPAGSRPRERQCFNWSLKAKKS